MSPDRHVFGPVPSRRLGASLGVDLIDFKTCSYDCVYCQLGRTSLHCSAAPEAVAPETIVAEVRERLASGPRPDWITLAGSGEPTLHPRLGEVLAGLRQFGVPVAVITNGSLLWREETAAACAGADLVSPTLVAGSEEVWRRVNRPHGSLDFRRMVDGLVAFRGRFRGQLWLEVMLVAGVNDSEDEVRRIAALAGRIRPDRVQLNTAVRPPAESSVRPVPPERLAELARLFDPPAEVIAETPRAGDGGGRREAPFDKLTAQALSKAEGQGAQKGLEEPSTQAPCASCASLRQDRSSSALEEVLALIGRHPSTEDDVAAGLAIPAAEARRLLAELAAAGRAVPAERSGRTYWSRRS
ncbi:MAG TPA: radical SAM protein [Planctomycetota bacterium]|nr:radical SAM protein [Planctomycetota bacterium]